MAFLALLNLGTYALLSSSRPYPQRGGSGAARRFYDPSNVLMTTQCGLRKEDQS